MTTARLIAEYRWHMWRTVPHCRTHHDYATLRGVLQRMREIRLMVTA